MLFDFFSFDRHYANIPTCHGTMFRLNLDHVVDNAIDYEMDHDHDAVVVENCHETLLLMMLTIEIAVHENK